MEILQFKDVKTNPDPIHVYTDSIRAGGIPLIIDNGSYNSRVGWAVSEKPQLVFKNVIAKPRKERGKKDGETQVGNDIINIEAVRFQLKTQFDRNVVTHYEVQEHILNYTFTHLGIDTEGSVNHPIVMTEAFLNPNYCRMLMSELLFECYGVPGVFYGVDSLFSFSRDSKSKPKTGLIVSCGYHTTHIIPVIRGKADPQHARRMDVGGSHITGYLHRLLQLKYPSHFAALTLSRAEELLHDHCRIVEDYQGELKNWSDADYYDNNVLCIQLPYTAASGGSLGLTPEQQRERRRELARRLTEINARKREEKLAEDEEQLNQLLAIQDLQEEGEEAEFQCALKDFGLGSSEELPKMIGQIQVRIEKTKQKIVAANTAEDPISEEPKQKILKQFQTPKDEEDFKSWVAGVRKKREELLERRALRRQRRQEMAKRRTPASLERMRLINQLARNEKRDDDFGMRDEDWDVYKAINKEGGDSDSEGEAEKLMELEQVLRVHDPGFCSNGENSNGVEEAGEAHRLHFGVERIRAPEVLFQPSLIGSHQAGLADTIDYVLKSYDEETASLLASDIYLTGGMARIPGLRERLLREITILRPFGSRLNIRISPSPSLNAWLGARNLAADGDSLKKYLVTQQEYQEKGGEYLKEHSASNVYIPSPLPLSVIETLPNSNTSHQEDIEIDIV